MILHFGPKLKVDDYFDITDGQEQEIEICKYLKNKSENILGRSVISFAIRENIKLLVV